jgi:N-acetylglucosamine kinase-like BadF-type ATPase
VSRRVVVGVDGGGTKTLALVAGLDGQRLGQGLAGASNYNAAGFEAACREIEAAILRALESAPGEVSAICLGLAGAGRPEDVERFLRWGGEKFPEAALKVVSDVEILLACTRPGPALALICGTGSIVYGRTAEGELLRAGGWGYLFGDEGSGYAIGAAALRAVMRAEDGRGAATLLSALLLARCGVKTPQGLVRSIYGAEMPRAEIAGLAELVEQAAAQKDALALSILDVAANDLAEMVQAVQRRLGSLPLPLALTGGMILHGSILAGLFRRACEERRLVFSSVTEVAEPVEGAVRLALGV